MNVAGNSPDPQDVAAETGAPAESAAVKEAAELKDRLLRTLADMENLRRRTEREVADSRQYAIATFARDLLGVADNMERALGTLSADFRDQADPVIKSHIEGVEITERELIKVMEKHGIRKFDPQGQKFDPNLHQAMMQVPDPSVPDGTVVQVMQPGYMIADRVLRPALVGVSKGGPKAGPAEAAANDDATAPRS
ncbi:MAG TPA: nucleotide exchange factor GrpE [Xanthobacteraceae bacterium]|jgi:molecular chaperone GrpE|nr:nucleotide exchange factor GrpE [Xanthobacteraceae bacterium]